jgi:hypothetical protein
MKPIRNPPKFGNGGRSRNQRMTDVRTMASSESVGCWIDHVTARH